ncbi:uncharacterized protein A1O9_01683 [Exophiala aquamarina CBS 119918]|uniref:Uncharacterized protein n=1 Tax=Exophiala aquamarina CBS 119918 TaxID=1182545 RepID=A0A072Q6Z0_9EURO|nr:uncharacterized protein A1O9_01683 [Exophiala aquamarina CBS 119918]KEF63705.1 hypothetical protein A1O9_01683 [Exophiala aquamarina CBS 119918]
MYLLASSTILSLWFAHEAHRNIHKRQTIVSAQNLPALPFVQSDLPSVETGCAPGDVVSPHWQANSIDKYMSGYPNFGEAPFRYHRNPRLSLGLLAAAFMRPISASSARPGLICTTTYSSKRNPLHIPAWVHDGLSDQNLDIFLNSHPPGAVAEMLKSGIHLGLFPTQAEYQSAMERSLKVFLDAQLWSKIDMQLMITNPDDRGLCIAEAARLIRGQCMQFKYPDGSNLITPATGETPRDAIGGLSSAGLDFDKAVNNVLDCNTAGKSASDVDFEGFFASGEQRSQDIPACLFGLYGHRFAGIHLKSVHVCGGDWAMNGTR